jgi:hypothetical protein
MVEELHAYGADAEGSDEEKTTEEEDGSPEKA